MDYSLIVPQELPTSIRDLDLVLSYLTGNRVTGRDIYTALGMPKATYFSQRDKGRLHQPENLLRLARAYDVNPLDLLIEYGHIVDGDVADYQRASAGRAATPKQSSRGDLIITDVDELRASPRGRQGVDSGASNGGVRQLVVEVPAVITEESSANLIEALSEAFDAQRLPQ